MNIVILVRCMWCMYIRKRWDNPQAVVFVPSMLWKYIETTCDHCGKQGMEIYVGEMPESHK
jgi:hypothetical protein